MAGTRMKIGWIFTILLIKIILSQTLIDKNSNPEWPNFIISVKHQQHSNFSVHFYEPSSETSHFIASALQMHRSLTANFNSGKICHFHSPNSGIICHQNGTVSIPDIPRCTQQKANEIGDSPISLSPFGDHLIFEEVHQGGVWILNLNTQRSRLLIPYYDRTYKNMEVDWDRGYVLTLAKPTKGSKEGIEVWELLGDSLANFKGHIRDTTDAGARIKAFTIDVENAEVYWTSDSHLIKAKYNQLPKLRPDTLVTIDNLKNLCYYRNGLFWPTKKSVVGGKLSQTIQRLDFETKLISFRNFNFSQPNDRIDQIVLYEPLQIEKNSKSNPCSICSHICIPHRDPNVRFECACPFEQPLQEIQVNGVKPHCRMGLNVTIITHANASFPGQSQWSLRTHDAMRELNDSHVSSGNMSNEVHLFQDGFCFQVFEGEIHYLSCYNGMCESVLLLSPWPTEFSLMKVLAINRTEDSIIWLDQNFCISIHIHETNQTWNVTCNPEIDPDNVVLDHANWYLFYRNSRSGALYQWDLTKTIASTTILESAAFFEDVHQPPRPMRLAVDMSHQILYYLSSKELCKFSYNSKIADKHPSILFDLDTLGFRDQQLKFIEGFLYWVEIRPTLPNLQEYFVVRFDLQYATRETFLKSSSGYAITFFDVQKSGATEVDCSTGSSSIQCPSADTPKKPQGPPRTPEKNVVTAPPETEVTQVPTRTPEFMTTTSASLKFSKEKLHEEGTSSQSFGTVTTSIPIFESTSTVVGKHGRPSATDAAKLTPTTTTPAVFALVPEMPKTEEPPACTHCVSLCISLATIAFSLILLVSYMWALRLCIRPSACIREIVPVAPPGSSTHVKY